MQGIDILFWLEEWAYKQYQQDLKCKILIATIDNPGWGITVNLENVLNEEFSQNLPLSKIERTENDWYHSRVKNNNFEGDGGLYNLEEILSEFINLINSTIGNLFPDEEKITDKNLIYLIQWFANQCDGDWEHGNGVRIGTLDNPGWYLNVDLYETELEKKNFNTINIKRTEYDWVYCEVKDNKFQGCGGLYNLSEIFSIFREWAEQNES